MANEGLEKFFQREIDEFEENVVKARTARPFVEQDPDGELLDTYVTAVHSLIARSQFMSELIDEFLESGQVDRELVDRAKKLVSTAKSEIALFHEQRDFAALDISDETGKLQ